MRPLLYRQAKTDLKKFGIAFFAKHLCDATPEFHDDINRLLQSDATRLAIAAPRGHAKSTLVSLFYTLFEALNQRKRFILLVSDTHAQAANLLRDIKHELETNAELFEAYGDQVNAQDKWTESLIVLRNGCRIEAAGAGKSLRGLREGEHRPDLVIVDDLENDEGVISAQQRANLRGWFVKVLENMLDPKCGRIVVIGTVLHPYSLLAWLTDAARTQQYTKRVYRAILPDGTALFPARFSVAMLEGIRANIGGHAFACEYLNNPVDDDTVMFKREWLKFYDRSVMTPEFLAQCDISAAIDPALKLKDTNDYFCCVTVARHQPTGKLYVLQIYRKRATVEHHYGAIVGQYQRWHWRKCWIEEVAFQEVLKIHIADKAAREGVYIPFEGIKPVSDKLLRIQNLQPLFENGHLLLDPAMREFIEDEYTCYPNAEFDDQLDALEMVVTRMGKRETIGIGFA